MDENGWFGWSESSGTMREVLGWSRKGSNSIILTGLGSTMRFPSTQSSDQRVFLWEISYGFLAAPQNQVQRRDSLSIMVLTRNFRSRRTTYIPRMLPPCSSRRRYLHCNFYYKDLQNLFINFLAERDLCQKIPRKLTEVQVCPDLFTRLASRFFVENPRKEPKHGTNNSQ